MHRFKTWQLFAMCVLTWSTTWYAITFQLGHLAPIVGVGMRFALAGLVLFAWCIVRGEKLRFTINEHARLLFQGAFMYGVSYVCVYEAERYVVSGLVAVGYSASPLVAGLGARALFRAPVTGRFIAGGLLGVLGLALIFWPEFRKTTAGPDAVTGAAFTIGGVLLSSVGSLAASRNRTHGLPLWPSLAFGMIYGAGICVLIAFVQGQAFVPPATISWWLSLFYLALAGSVLTFACFLTLQERVGPGRTAAIGVMTPLLALVVSTVFEGFRPDVTTVTGAALAVAGNVLMLRRA
jgi:drug/metabolite transporter (DMT)-like permease